MQIAISNALGCGGGEGPAFALDLMRPALDTRMTFSRASGATDIIDGVLTAFATDEPRISASNGLLIEEARTNSLRNAQAGGASAGVIGSGGVLPTNWINIAATGINVEVMGTGTRNGFSYVRVRLYGTPSTNAHQIALDSATQAAAGAGEVWTASCFMALAAGTLTGITGVELRCCEMASGAIVTSQNAALAVTGDIARVEATRTMASGTTSVQARLRFNLSLGVAVNATFDILAPQLELGAFATSYIATTNAAATRAADQCNIATGSWYNVAEGTVWAEGQAGGIDSAAVSSPRLLRLRDNIGQNFYELRRHTDRSLRAMVMSNNLTQASFTDDIWADGAVARVALAWRSNDIAMCFAGNSVQTDSSTPDGLPVGIFTLRLGAAASVSGFWNGYLRAVRVFTRRLSNAQLKAITR